MKGLLPALLLLLLGFTAPAQTFPAASPLPELDAIRGPYQKNLQTILATREKRLADLTQAYLLSLDRLQQELAGRGDLDSVLQVKEERDRAKGASDPTPTERRAMKPALAAARAKFDREFEGQIAPVRRAEEQQGREYLAALDALQRKLTMANRIEQATLIRTERESVLADLKSRESSVPAIAKATPAPAISATRAAKAGALDPAIAKKINDALRDKSFQLTESSEDTESAGGRDIPETAGVLVGFEFFEQKSSGFPDIRSLRPLFLTEEGIVPGKERGRMEKITNKVLAKPGYAVSGLIVHHNPGRIQGIQVVFMKMDAGTLRLDASPASTYRSLWFGTRPRSGKPKELADDGRPVVGVFGKSGADCDTIGLIQLAN